jgi:hypothetical protein
VAQLERALREYHERRFREYQERLLAVLGYQRCRLMACLGGDLPHRAPAFDPPPGADALAAFREFVASRLAMMTPDAMTGAARLLTGDLSGADLIIDGLPEQRRVLIGGRGMCAVMPFHALASALPLPAALEWSDTTWLAGSTQQARLRHWLEQHRGALRWDEIAGVYRSGEPPGSDASVAGS